VGGMNPQEKAEKLFYKFFVEMVEVYHPIYAKLKAKDFSIIVVDELIAHCGQVEPFLGVDYWEEVKHKIEKL
jgi:hypothetical protein